MRKAKKKPEGRAALRRRTTIEHSLARVSHIQGSRVRYRGVRENTSLRADVGRSSTSKGSQGTRGRRWRLEFTCSAL